MTVEELNKYDGKHSEVNNKCYIAVKDLVFDVTESHHYGEGGGYKQFLGKDISVGVAKMDFADQYYDTSKYHWKESLSDKELRVMQEWVVYYKQRYKLVAYL